jgi:hypothetical protein
MRKIWTSKSGQQYGGRNVVTLSVAVLCAVALLASPAPLAADSDLWVQCGQEFAVFDRIVQDGRELNVVPWTDEQDLRVAASVPMPEGQPHSWAIYNRYVVVRMWNHLHVYRIGDAYQPELILSRVIDKERGVVGGPTAIQIAGSILRVHGVERDLVLDFESCDDECVISIEPPAAVVPVQDHRPRCAMQRGEYLFGLTEATTRSEGWTYVDYFLTRRRIAVRIAPIHDPFRPESSLYLGTRGPYR